MLSLTVDEVVVFKQALSSSDVDEDYKSVKLTEPDALVSRCESVQSSTMSNMMT